MSLSDFCCVNRLKPREFEVFKLLGNGDSTGEIAVTLAISASCVRDRIIRIRHRLGIETVGHVRAFATRFVVLTETTPFNHSYPDGQAELDFAHELTEH